MPASRPAPGETFWRLAALALGVGLLFALLTALAFPPFSAFAGLAIVAPVPLAWLGGRLSTARLPRPRAGMAGVLGALVLGVLPLWLYEMQWVVPISAFGYFPMCVILACFAALLVWIVSRARRRFPRLPMAVLLPVAWVGVEFFRGDLAATGFGWMLLAHPLIAWPWAAAAAAVGGTYFVSALAAALAGSALDLAGQTRAGLIALASVAVVWGVASWLGVSTRPEPAGRLRVAVVQTNIPQDNKMTWTPEQRLDSMRRFEALTRQAADAQPGVIVWPETMFPGMVLDPASVRSVRDAGMGYRVAATPALPEGALLESDFVDRLIALQREVGRPILVGAAATENLVLTDDGEGITPSYDARFNSVFLVHGGVVSPRRYDKLELTPFGEVLPYISSWPALRDWVKRNLGAVGMYFDLTPGRHPVAFDLPATDGPVQAVTPICFEATRARLCRRLVRFAQNEPGPVVIINLTNDGWFSGFDPARAQHAQAARWRAVELGVPVVRAANTGVSSAIDASGAITEWGTGAGDYRVEGVMVADVFPARSRTIYGRIGDVCGWTCLAGAVGLGAWPRRSDRKEAA